MSLRSSSTVLVCTQVSITYVWQGLHRPKDTKDSTLFVTFTSHSHLLEHTLTLLHTQTCKPQTLTPSATEDSRRWPLTQLSHRGQLFSFRVTSFIWNFNGFKIRNIEKKKHRADVVFLSIKVRRSKTQKYFSFFLIFNYFGA